MISSWLSLFVSGWAVVKIDLKCRDTSLELRSFSHSLARKNAHQPGLSPRRLSVKQERSAAKNGWISAESVCGFKTRIGNIISRRFLALAAMKVPFFFAAVGPALAVAVGATVDNKHGGGESTALSSGNATLINLVCHDRPYGALCGSSNGGYCDIDWTGDVEVGKCQVWSEPHVGSYSWMIAACNGRNATHISFPDSTDCTGRSVTSYTPSDQPLGECFEADPKSSCASSGGTSCMSVCTPIACTHAIAQVCDKGEGCTKCCAKNLAELSAKGCAQPDLVGFCYSP